MSEAAFEATEAEAFEASGDAYEGEGGEAYEGEAGEASYDAWGEDARSRQRARQRRIIQERQLQARRRRPPPPRRPVITAPSPAPSPAVRAVRSEVRSLDLDTKVALDSLRAQLSQAHRLAYRNAWAAEASVAASQVLDSFEDGLKPHDWARALIRGAPTLVLAPGKPIKPGVAGYLFDPRVAGGAVVAAIFAIGHFRGTTRGVNSISITPSGTVEVHVGESVNLFGVAVDHKGNDVDGITLNWDPQDPTVSLDTKTGPKVVCTGAAVGNTVIRVTGGGATARVSLNVIAADLPSGSA
jgi:hypothetical protein